MSLSRNQINDYLACMNIDGKVVYDVGCGLPKHYARTKTQGKATKYVTFEYTDEFGADYKVDLNEPWETYPVENKEKVFNKADLVFCIETLEHIYDPVTAIGNLNLLLKVGGELVLTTPFINPLHDTHDYLRYTIQYFEDVLPKLGFEVLEIIPRVATSGAKELNDLYKNEGLRMSKITHKAGYGKNYLDIGYIVKARKVEND